MIKFTWDERKAAQNEKKHGVSFDEAMTAFDDENGRLIFDPDHSANEDRFILLGLSASLRILVVCHCYRENESLIRIISARKATRKETGQYRSHL
ncbi:MAG: BrnT family toxin [Victivallaceae bacterium]|nr:BrnT family toxin [Victivallaceae bacterium]